MNAMPCDVLDNIGNIVNINDVIDDIDNFDDVIRMPLLYISVRSSNHSNASTSCNIEGTDI